MTDAEITQLVSKLESKSSIEEENAWSQLKVLGVKVVPYLRAGYKRMTKANGRLSCVFHSIRFGRISEEAFLLGVEALSDRATLVRYRACGLLAYSLRKDAIPHLKLLLFHSDTKTVEDAKAAIESIKKSNHHLFVDRNHTGRSFWTVNPED